MTSLDVCLVCRHTLEAHLVNAWVLDVPAVERGECHLCDCVEYADPFTEGDRLHDARKEA